MQLRHTLSLLLIGITAWTAGAQIMLDSRHAVLDSLTGNWLCSIPEAVFGTDYTATVTNTAGWTDITIDGTTVTPGTSYTFAQVAGEKKYRVVAHVGDSVAAQGNLCFTFLPIFELTGTFTNDYQVTDVVAHMPQNQGPTTMLTKVKHRGATTNQEFFKKRNYHLKFINPDSTKMDRKFFGLRNDNSWILDAGVIDLLRIRNRVATELWLDMCRKPYYADREPKALLGVRGDFIEVFLNGNYQGFYALTENMDRKQMKLVKYDEADTTGNNFHGQLWKAKTNDGLTYFRSYYGFNVNSENWGGFEVKYPDPDDVMPTTYKTLYDAVKFVATNNRAEFVNHAGEYFDLPVIMDYWILINAILGIDSGVKNIYWGVYDQAVDKKLTLAAWDLDCTFGQNWLNYPLHNPNVVAPTLPLKTFNNLLLRLHEYSPDSFCIKTVERYQLLRKTLLSTDSLKNRFRTRLEPLRRSGTLAREMARWSRSSDISNQELNFDSELAYIENWIDQRMAYLDNARFKPYIPGDTNRDGLVDVGDINYCINTMLHSYPMWYEDMNNDLTLDVSDLNIIVNILLGRQ